MRRSTIRPAMLALVAGLLLPASGQAASPGNFLSNPGAEDASPGLPSWTFSDAWSARSYGDQGGYPEIAAGTAIGGELHFFSPGELSGASPQVSVASQTASLGATPPASVLFGGDFGGYADQRDTGFLRITFLTAADAPVGQPSVVGGPSPADRMSQTVFVSCSATAAVPAGAAKVRAEIVTVRTDGTEDDGYTDNLYVGTSATLPTPASGAGCHPVLNPDGTEVATAPAPAPVPAPGPAPVPTPISKPAPQVKPVRLKVAAVVSGLPSAKRCLSRRAFRIRLRKPASGPALRSVKVLVNGRSVAVRKGARLTAPVDLKGLPRGSYTVRIVLTALDGQTVSQSRTYHTCVPKRKR